MRRRPPTSNRTDTLFPSTTPFPSRSVAASSATPAPTSTVRTRYASAAAKRQLARSPGESRRMVLPAGRKRISCAICKYESHYGSVHPMRQITPPYSDSTGGKCQRKWCADDRSDQFRRCVMARAQCDGLTFLFCCGCRRSEEQTSELQSLKRSSY